MIWLLHCLLFPLLGSSASSQTSLAYFSFPIQLEGSGLAFSDYQFRLIHYYGNITVNNVSIVTSRTDLTFDTNGFYYPEYSRDKLYKMIFELEKTLCQFVPLRIAVKGIDWVDNDLIAYTQPPEELIDHLDKTLARYGFIPIMKDKSEILWKNYSASSRKFTNILLARADKNMARKIDRKQDLSFISAIQLHRQITAVVCDGQYDDPSCRQIESTYMKPCEFDGISWKPDMKKREEFNFDK